MSELKVSIITVSLNSVATIERTIKSVLMQSYANIEYIVIDGGSTDGTQDVIEKYKDKLAYYVSEPDNGIYDAFNKGINIATGDIVGIINSDDWYVRDAVKKVVNCFINTDAGVVHGSVWLYDKKGNKSILGGVPLENIRFNMIIAHPSVFIRRDVYETYGKFDCRYKIAADYDLMLRLYLANVKFYHIDDIIAHFSYGGYSIVNLNKSINEKRNVSLSYIKEYPIYERDYVLKKIEDVYSMSKLNLNIDERPEIILGIIEGAFSDIGEGVAIWGVGKWGMKLYGLLEKCSIPIIYFLDNNKCKCGQRINGVKVKNPENLKNEETRTNIIIAVRYFGDEVSKQLEAYGNQNIRWITLDEIASENVGIDCNEEN